MTDATLRLDQADAYQLEFDAEVRAHATDKGRPSLILDRSAFYPESGGQMADAGTLGGLRVLDVQIDDDGRVHHVLDGALPELGARVHGSVDGVRRRIHRALHTGQHLFSRALLDVAGAETLSSRLGETDCTIDTPLAGLDESAVFKAADVVNRVIDEDRAVRAFYPSPDELAALPLRRAPKVTDNIRVIEVEGADVTPCGGTHVAHSSEIELLYVTGLEKKKGGVRVHFAAGPRARTALFARDALVRGLCQRFTCGDDDIPKAIDKLERQLKEAQQKLGQAESALAEASAKALLDDADDGRVIHIFEGRDAGFLGKVAAPLLERPLVVCLAAANPDGTAVLIARGPGVDVDCGAVLKALAQATGGKGGGKPDCAQGRLPAGVDVATAARAAFE